MFCLSVCQSFKESAYYDLFTLFEEIWLQKEKQWWELYLKQKKKKKKKKWRWSRRRRRKKKSLYKWNKILFLSFAFKYLNSFCCSALACALNLCYLLTEGRMSDLIKTYNSCFAVKFDNRYRETPMSCLLHTRMEWGRLVKGH